MSVVEFEELIEACIRRLEEGEDLDVILASYPNQAGELQSLLAAMVDARRMVLETTIPAAAQSRSRAQFLTAAAAMLPAPRKPRFTLFHLRLATSAIIGIGIIAAVLLGTGLASAASLPGDVFYPVKLMVEQIHINIVQNSPTYLELQETYDNRRLQEAEKLSQMNRRQQVTFGGFLTQSDADRWQVGSVVLAFPADFPVPTNLIGTYVQVSGYSVDQEVEVEEIQPRQLQWSGILQKFDDRSWLVGGVALTIDADTKVTGGKPQVGVLVQVTAIRQSESQFLALSLHMNGESAPRDIQTVSSSTPTLPPVEETQAGESAAAAQPVARPSSPSTSTPVIPTAVSSPAVKNTEVSKTGTGGDEDNQTGKKKTPTPAVQVTVSNSDNATPTPKSEDGQVSPTQKAPENKVATQTPTPPDD